MVHQLELPASNYNETTSTTGLLDEEKKFYDRFWNLLNDRDLMMVFERWGPLAFRRSSVLEGFEQFLKEHEICGECAVEIGTLTGLTALVLKRYFRRVVSIDIIDDPLKWEIARELCINIEFINVKDNYEKFEQLQHLSFDFAYVDGNHTDDTNTDVSLTKRCGRLMFHDWDLQPTVRDALRSLQTKGKVVRSRKFALWTR